jgi:hypothetical protein
MPSQVLYYNVASKKRFTCSQDEWIALQRNPLFRGRFKKVSDIEQIAGPAEVKEEIQASQKKNEKAGSRVVDVTPAEVKD